MFANRNSALNGIMSSVSSAVSGGMSSVHVPEVARKLEFALEGVDGEEKEDVDTPRCATRIVVLTLTVRRLCERQNATTDN